ncbi:MAG: hypothetical protein ACOVMG_00615 [Flavobacterium sp.]
MKTSRVALIIYFLFCFLAVFADVLRNESLTLISLPFIIPAISFYYLIETKKKNYLLLLFLLCCFIGDSIGLMNFDNEVYYILVPFFIANLVLLVMAFQNLERFKFNVFNIPSLVILILFVGYLWYSIVDLFLFHELLIRILIMIYGGLLFFVTVFAGYNLICKMNNTNLFSDTFYIVYNYQTQLVVLDVLHFLAQVLSYYFITKYALTKEASKTV